jgi:hypothetical protein
MENEGSSLFRVVGLNWSCVTGLPARPTQQKTAKTFLLCIALFSFDFLANASIPSEAVRDCWATIPGVNSLRPSRPSVQTILVLLCIRFELGREARPYQTIW